MAHRQAGEGAAGVGVGVRRALAGQVGQEREALGPGLPALGLGHQRRRSPRPGAATSRSQRSEPAAESITPIACQAPGTAWQKVCTRASGSAANASSAVNTTPEVPITTDAGPGRSTPTPERARRLVARRRRPPARRPPSCPTPRATRARAAASASSSSRASSTDVRPAPARHVEQQRAAGVRHVDGLLAAQAQPHVVLGQQHRRDPPVGLGLVAAQPQQLRRGEAGERPVAGRAISSAAHRSSISAHSAAVRWSFQRIAGRTTSSAESSATSPCIWPERPMPAGSPAARSSSSTAAPPSHHSSGSCSAQPGRGVANG